MNKSKRVAICLITDEGYAMPTCVALYSVLANKNKSTSYQAYVICSEVSAKTKERIASVATNGLNITFIDADSISQKSNYKIKGISATPTSLYKFYLPEILKNEKKVIFLDGDLIVQSDLFELYDTNLENNLAGAVKDVKGLSYPNLGDPRFSYFNSGVVLLNLEEMRKEKTSAKMMDYRKNGINKLMDQDAMNYVLKGRTVLVPFRWNTQISALISNIRKKNSFTVKKIRSYWELNAQTSIDPYEILKQASVIHYTTTKPWKYFDVIGSESWTKYYYNSPYGDEPLNLKSKYVESGKNRFSVFASRFVYPLRIFVKRINIFKDRKYEKFLIGFVRNDK